MRNSVRQSYDQLAIAYAQRLYGELVHKPFDRHMLNWLIERTPANSLICDLGCGPGQVARYLHDQGAKACGIDLSSGMIAQASALSPMIDFQTGDMTNLENVADSSYGGIAAFYSIVHLPPEQLPAAFNEFWRVLLQDGTLLLTFHVGDEVRHFDTLWDMPVDLNFIFFRTNAIVDLLTAAGLKVTEVIERWPYPESVEVQTRRAYIFATKSSEPS